MELFYLRMNVKQALLLLMTMCLFFSSCGSEETEFVKPDVENVVFSKKEAMDKFAIILSKALTDKNIREFIKHEALKQIDNDYDVIYHYVKNEKMANGLTFSEGLAKFCDGEEFLNKIANEDNLLTIYVPFIDSTFSAENWKIETQIPSVCVRNNDNEDDLLLFGKDEQRFLSRKQKPDFPVLVIKSNERLANANAVTKTNSKGLSNKDGLFAYFLDDSFDNSRQVQTKTAPVGVSFWGYPDDSELLKRAFLGNKECVRDFIYYGIGTQASGHWGQYATTSNKGTLNTNNRERIVSVEFCDPNVFEHVKDGFDPIGDWTDGNLELCFDFIFVDKSEKPFNIQKFLSVRNDQLIVNPSNPTGTLVYVLNEPIEIFNWDIYTYGNMYKISVSEYDPGTIIEKTVTHSSTFGLNFEYNAGIDLDVVKVGSKYAGSVTDTKHTSLKIQSTNNSDPLGDVIVNFFDPIYLNENINIEIWGGYFQTPRVDTPNSIINLSFSTSEALWSFIDRAKRGEDEFCNRFPFIWIIDKTVYGDMYTSNTGMIKLKIQPGSLSK